MTPERSAYNQQQNEQSIFASIKKWNLELPMCILACAMVVLYHHGCLVVPHNLEAQGSQEFLICLA